MIMNFPFITIVERNEKSKKSINNLLPVDCNTASKNKDISNKNIQNKEIQNKEILNEYDNMICLSNLEEIVFDSSCPCPRKYIFDSLKPNKSKSNIDYDKYLDFFE